MFKAASRVDRTFFLSSNMSTRVSRLYLLKSWGVGNQGVEAGKDGEVGVLGRFSLSLVKT